MLTPEEWLAHPIVLLIVGAALTAGTGSLITRLWEDRKKILEVKLSLIQDMSDTISNALEFSVSLAALRLKTEDLTQQQSDEYKEKFFQKVNTRGNMITAKLLVYSTSLSEEWDKYFGIMELYIVCISKMTLPIKTGEITKQLQERLPKIQEYVGKDVLSDSQIQHLLQGYNLEIMTNIGRNLRRKGYELMRKLKNTKIRIA